MTTNVLELGSGNYGLAAGTMRLITLNLQHGELYWHTLRGGHVAEGADQHAG